MSVGSPATGRTQPQGSGWQQGAGGRRAYVVAIEVGTWRSGRTGSARGWKPMGSGAGRRKGRGPGGKASRARRRGRHTPRCIRRRGDGSPRRAAPRSDPAQLSGALVPDSRARCASAAWRERTSRWNDDGHGQRSTANISWARLGTRPFDRATARRRGVLFATHRDGRGGRRGGRSGAHAPRVPSRHVTI